MALWVCLGCTTKYAVGLFRCPRCHSTEFVEDGQPMPKNTRATGASNAADAPAEEEPWPGSSSSTSSPTPEPKRSKSTAGRRKPAPTTESPSEPDPTESSTAPSMAGQLAEETSQTEGSD